MRIRPHLSLGFGFLLLFATAHAAAGQLEEAVALEKKAIEKAVESKHEDLNDYHERLLRYESKLKPPRWP